MSGEAVTNQPCPTCSGPGRETVDMACQTCGTYYGQSMYPPLRPELAVLHVCLICGAVVPAKGIQFHDDYHKSTAGAAIESQHRLDTLGG